MVEIPASDQQPTEQKPPVTEPVVTEQPIEETATADQIPKPAPTSIPQEPMAKIKLAAQLDVRTDKLTDEQTNVQALIDADNEAKKSELTKETLRRINAGGDSAWADPEMWNDITSGISALKTTTKLEDEKADLIFDNMFSKEKENNTDRQLRIAELNQQLHGMRLDCH